MQTSDDENSLFFVQLDLFSGGSEWCVEPLLKSGTTFEDRWEQKVEQGPQLGQFILQGRASE